MLLMPHIAIVAPSRSPDQALVERVYRTRALGFGLGFVCLTSVLAQLHAHPLAWVLLATNAFAWPPLARLLALRARDPVQAEMRHLLLDSAMGGAWIALMQFNLLPSVLIALMLALDKIRFGGVGLLLRGVAVQVAACVLTVAICGFAFTPQTTTLNILASLPLLVAYPLAMSISAYALARTVRVQERKLARMHQAGLDRE